MLATITPSDLWPETTLDLITPLTVWSKRQVRVHDTLPFVIMDDGMVYGLRQLEFRRH